MDAISRKRVKSIWKLIMNRWLDNAKRNLLEKSNNLENFQKAKEEWYFDGNVIDNNDEIDIDEERPSCELCEHEDLRWQFIIKNKVNENTLKVGSTCIKQFDIILIEKSGYISIGEERDKKIKKSISEKLKEAYFNNVLEALRNLWRKDKENRYIIEEAAKQWKEKNAFSPSMLLFLLFRFDINKINYEKLKFKLMTRSEKHKSQMEDLNKQRYMKIREYLSEIQKKYYDSYFRV